jgi:acyl-coenzyme A thioesterase PaaI-like protein
VSDPDDTTEPLSADAFTTAARLDFADAVRDLVDVALTAEAATDAELEEATAVARSLARSLAGVGADESVRGTRGRVETVSEDYRHRSVVIGGANPLAPAWEWSEKPGELRAWGVFGAPYEGPAGLVHGGYIALVFDEFLGMYNANQHDDALTGSLAVRYRRPTPLHQPVEVVVTSLSDEGRKVINTATLTCNGEITASAEGTFIRTTVPH